MDDDAIDDEALAEGDARVERLAKGLRPALEQLAEGERGLVGEMADHQLALFPTAAVDLDDEPEALETRRGAGRPAGSRNRATSEASEWFLSRWRSPLAFLGEAYTRPTVLLAQELKCSIKAAYAFQQAAALGAAPYVHRKQPIAIEGDEGVQPLMLIVRPDQMDRLAAGEITIMDVMDEMQQDQGVSDDDDGQSDGEKSDSGASD